MKEKQYQFQSIYKKYNSDSITPIELYLKIRDSYPNSFLLESSDQESIENSYTYLCFDPISSFTVEKEKTKIQYPDREITLDTKSINLAQTLYDYSKSFDSKNFDLKFSTHGLFGYTSYDAIPLFENITFKKTPKHKALVQYFCFKYVFVFDHFHSTIHCFEHLLEQEKSQLNSIVEIFQQTKKRPKSFHKKGEEISTISNEDFLKMIQKGKKHCHRGDVFQVVLSKEFQQKFSGDDFQVYRALRSINPSPYLFYFDLGEMNIFGSSPEAQLIIKDQKATINPIAGTFKRTGNSKQDQELANQLLQDPKENAEHTMLVDLARNDLSKSSAKVKVERLKEIEFYSHVIHLVSKVSSVLDDDYNPIQILGQTYPAGTLSGAPKHRAMQIIEENEPDARGLYGGTIGFLGFNGNINHAIFIRSFMSQNQTLHYRAGCGIVIHSNPKSELEEVNNKLGALRKAINHAETL